MPFEGSDNENSGIVYVWIGNKAAAEEAKLVQEIAEEMFNNPWVSLQVSSVLQLFTKIIKNNVVINWIKLISEMN